MTVNLYARRKGWPLEEVLVSVTHGQDGAAYGFRRSIRFVGALGQEQRERLLDIANKCPVHTTLSGRIAISTELQ